MSDRDTATDEPAEPPVSGVGSGEEAAQVVCWICRQPIDRLDLHRWRAEPVHRDCLDGWPDPES